MKSQRYDRQNPRFSSTDTGVEANHSSTVPSTESDLDHAQSDEELINYHGDGNPNIAGTKEIEDLYTWLAGRLEGWKENDDYRTYFEKGRSAEGLNGWGTSDGDYDDNGGIPLGVGQDYGDIGSTALYGDSKTYSIGTVITRRI